jgi:hypothetical protein
MNARLVVMATAAAVVAGTIPGQAAPAQVTAAVWSWSQTPAVTVHSGPADGAIVGNSAVSAMGPIVMYSWSQNQDVGSADPVVGYKRSTDGGATFPVDHSTGDTGFGTSTRLKDGTLIDVAFIPISIASPTQVNLRVKKSSAADNGANWTPVTSTLTTTSGFTWGGMNRGLRINQGMLTDAAGNLYLSYYTRYSGDLGTRVETAISRDSGVTWTRFGPIIQSSSTQQYNEAALSWAPNGEMVAVVTQDEVAPGASSRKHIKLITARSQEGRAWTGHTVLPISYDAGYSIRPDQDGVRRYGVSPSLVLLGNGAMTLRFGRPDNWFAISTDGGHSFVQARRTYVNYPQNGLPYHGSSGNGNHAAVANDRVIVAGDNCAPSWGCPAEDSGFTIDNKYRVWKKFITVTRPANGEKIAATARTAGHYTFAQPRKVTEIGVRLASGVSSDARVEGLVEGTWQEIARFDDIKGYCLSYKRVDATVGEVRVVGTTAVEEVELYS